MQDNKKYFREFNAELIVFHSRFKPQALDPVENVQVETIPENNLVNS